MIYLKSVRHIARGVVEWVAERIDQRVCKFANDTDQGDTA